MEVPRQPEAFGLRDYVNKVRLSFIRNVKFQELFRDSGVQRQYLRAKSLKAFVHRWRQKLRMVCNRILCSSCFGATVLQYRCVA